VARQPITLLNHAGAARSNKGMAMILRNERGANLVEMALSMILLLLLLAGVIDFGRAFFSYIAVTNASREGARYASRYPDVTDGIEDAVQREIDNAGITCAALAVTVDPTSPPVSGNPISVTVSCDYNTILGPALDGLLGTSFTTLSLAHSTEMAVIRKE